MGWLSNNWIWILLIGGFIAMHAFGHSHGHGGHRRSQVRESDSAVDEDGHAGRAAVTTESGQTGEQRRRRGGC